MGYLRDQAWNQTIYRLAFQKEWDKLGLAVSDDELVDMVQGDNINAGIKQAFTDKATGQFDKAKLIDYLKNLDKAPPEQQQMWHQFEAGLPAERLANKYNALLKNSVYVTTAEAKRYNDNQNTKATVKYLFVPYGSISDSAVKVTDAQLQAYLDKNQGKYKVEDGRSVEYITVPVVASKDDSTAVKTTMETLASQFAAAPVDSLFVKMNSDQPYTAAFRGPDALPEQLRKQLPLTAGQVYGPYAENGTYSLFKVTGTKTGDKAAARASHILIKADSKTPEAEAAAKAKAQDLLNKIKGGADFAAMARQFGTDGTKDQGGDLGWFGAGRMVPEFEKSHFWRNGPRLAARAGENLVRLPHHQNHGRAHQAAVSGGRSEEDHRAQRCHPRSRLRQSPGAERPGHGFGQLPRPADQGQDLAKAGSQKP